MSAYRFFNFKIKSIKRNKTPALDMSKFFKSLRDVLANCLFTSTAENTMVVSMKLTMQVIQFTSVKLGLKLK